MGLLERVARAINPGAWSLHDRMPEHRDKDPYHASDLDMSLAAAKRVELALSKGSEG